MEEWDVLWQSKSKTIMLQVGSDIAIRHYWDLGRWAELWRVWRTPADDRHRDEPLDLKVVTKIPFLV